MSDIIPENGFGQAAVNNTNGFGKAVVNSTNGYGIIQGRTWGHPTTNLTGASAFPLDGLMWSQIFNNAYATHSGTGRNFVQANGDNISFADLTGRTITSQIGTANLVVSGNNVVPSNDGSAFQFTFDNGEVFNLFQSNSPTYGSNGTVGEVNGATIITGSNQGEQLYNWGYNEYDFFNGVDNSVVLTEQSLNATTLTFSIVLSRVTEQQIFQLADTTEGTKTALTVNSTSGGIAMWAVSKPLIADTAAAANTYIENTVTPTIGVKYDISITFNSGVGISSFSVNGVNGVSSTGAVSRLTGSAPSGSRFMLRQPFPSFATQGILINVNWDGAEFNTFNNWQNGSFAGTRTKEIITGSTFNFATDIFGNVIYRPYIENVYNAPNNGVNNFAQLEQTANTDIDTSGEVTIGMWYYTPKREPFARYFVHNEQFGVVASSNNAILVEVGGQYVATLGIFEKEAEWEMLFFTVNASGVVNAYRADANNEPIAYGTPNQSGSGTPTAGTFPMYANNSNPAGSPIYSYNQVTGFWNKILTLDEMKDAWNATKDIATTSSIPESFPLTLPITLP